MAERGCLKDAHFQNLEVENAIHDLKLKKPTKKLSEAVKTIHIAESGTIFFLSPPHNKVLTLPTPLEGLEYTFIVDSTFTSFVWEINTDNDSVKMKGNIICADDTAGALHNGAHSETAIKLSGPTPKVSAGDWVKLISDGSHWYYSGCCMIPLGMSVSS